MYAYAHTPLDDKTKKITSFFAGEKLFAIFRGIQYETNPGKMDYSHNVLCEIRKLVVQRKFVQNGLLLENVAVSTRVKESSVKQSRRVGS